VKFIEARRSNPTVRRLERLHTVYARNLEVPNRMPILPYRAILSIKTHIASHHGTLEKFRQEGLDILIFDGAPRGPFC
jgi:hypothetical protein